jgi:hypothetical protein
MKYSMSSTVMRWMMGTFGTTRSVFSRVNSNSTFGACAVRAECELDVASRAYGIDAFLQAVEFGHAENGSTFRAMGSSPEWAETALRVPVSAAN